MFSEFIYPHFRSGTTYTDSMTKNAFLPHSTGFLSSHASHLPSLWAATIPHWGLAHIEVSGFSSISVSSLFLPIICHLETEALNGRWVGFRCSYVFVFVLICSCPNPGCIQHHSCFLSCLFFGGLFPSFSLFAHVRMSHSQSQWVHLEVLTITRLQILH